MSRRVLVTGANGGIGLATTIAASNAGWEVIAGIRNVANRELVEEAAPHAIVTRLDVADARRCEQVIDEFRPDAIVNNAGFGSAGAIEEVDDDEVRRQLEVMTVAPMRLARLGIPHMRERRHGVVVNVSSLGGRTACALTGWYTGAKHALEAATDALRIELARDGIKVVLIEPGGVTTGILEKTTAAMDDTRRDGSRYEESYRRAEVLTRLTQRFQGDPDRVAAVIVDALDRRRPRARYVVGLDARLLFAAGRFPTPVKDRFKRAMLKL